MQRTMRHEVTMPKRSPKPKPAAITTNTAMREQLGGLPITYTLRSLLLKLNAAEHCMHHEAEHALLTALHDKRPLPPVTFSREVLRDAIGDLERLHRITLEYEVLRAE
jgi:hypothetical protein